MSPEKQPVKVTILGQQYTLLAGGDPREVIELARRVDTLMLSIEARLPNPDPTRVAVLACLHVADEARDLERKLAELKERIGRKTDEFSELLEQALGE